MLSKDDELFVQLFKISELKVATILAEYYQAQKVPKMATQIFLPHYAQSRLLRDSDHNVEVIELINGYYDDGTAIWTKRRGCFVT
jgi:hypothetical protein